MWTVAEWDQQVQPLLGQPIREIHTPGGTLLEENERHASIGFNSSATTIHYTPVKYEDFPKGDRLGILQPQQLE